MATVAELGEQTTFPHFNICRVEFPHLENSGQNRVIEVENIQKLPGGEGEPATECADGGGAQVDTGGAGELRVEHDARRRIGGSSTRLDHTPPPLPLLTFPPPPPYQGTVPEELYIRLARGGPVEAHRGGVQTRKRTSRPE